jgi:hypothetical protein
VNSVNLKHDFSEEKLFDQQLNRKQRNQISKGMLDELIEEVGPMVAKRL